MVARADYLAATEGARRDLVMDPAEAVTDVLTTAGHLQVQPFVKPDAVNVIGFSFGGGPCGLMLAIELGRRGILCLLVDATPGTAFNPQANADTWSVQTAHAAPCGAGWTWPGADKPASNASSWRDALHGDVAVRACPGGRALQVGACVHCRRCGTCPVARHGVVRSVPFHCVIGFDVLQPYSVVPACSTDLARSSPRACTTGCQTLS